MVRFNHPRLEGLIAVLLAVITVTASCGCRAGEKGRAWVRHTIDDSSRGADGVRLADANGDGLLDIATGWEEGGQVRVYLNPGGRRSGDKWPAVTVGDVGSPEDAVLADLDGDGAMDVVSCCQGRVKSMYIHWAPADRTRYLVPEAWETQVLPAAAGVTRWMFCLPLQIDGMNGLDLLAGSKKPNARIGWFEAPADPRHLAGWKWHLICDAGWTMSLVAADMDADGDLDMVVSDRKGPTRGCRWLENPGPGPAQQRPWNVHLIGAADKEVMFLALADLDRDGRLDVLAATRGRELIYLCRKKNKPPTWESLTIGLPPGAGTAKSVHVADVNLDGRPDIVFTCEKAEGKSGVMWMSYRRAVTDRVWDAHDVSGPEGAKYDLVRLLDLDGDQDLDVITCEEGRNLGVVWYENPTR